MTIPQSPFQYFKALTLNPSTKQQATSHLGGKGATSVVLIDDHLLVRDLTSMALEGLGPQFRVVAAVDDCKDALPVCRQLQPDVVLIRMNTPDSRWIEAFEKLKRRVPKARFLVTSTSSSSHVILSVLKTGVDGFIHEKNSWNELAEGIRRVASGQKYFCHRSSAVLSNAASQSSGARSGASTALTKRETEVLALIAAGYTSRAIASRLTLSAATVDTHRRNLMSKIGAHNAADLVLFAINEGLITAKGQNR